MGLLSAAVLGLFVLGAIASTPFEDLRSGFELRSETNLDDPAYRLKDTVQPSYQYVDLDVYLDENRFTGLTRIEVQVLEANISQIVLHQNVVSITALTVLDANNNVIPASFSLDSYYEIIMIDFTEVLNVDSYTIIIAYNGRINENPIDRGFYKGYYFLNGEKRYYATTQFQPYHARKAFPCFDEPQFKNQFVISITRAASLSKSYSNMAINTTEILANGRVKETFLPTPIISSYLIAFHVSDFVETTLTGTADKPVGIVSRPGATGQHNYAAEMAWEITEWMSEYFNFEYYDMGHNTTMKNDHIALPDFPSGAMENWGMVNYREAYLLYDQYQTNILNKIFIATIVGHEMAHKWFGNLVTCFWWSNLWLNESYASFFEYFAAHNVDPELELADQFVVDYVHSALLGDASASATPMNWTGVVNNPSVSAHFSSTSYAKGASVLRMMEHFVTASTFRKALEYYLRDHAYNLGTPERMYDAFREAVSEDCTLSHLSWIDVGEVFDSYVQNPGAPLVNVEVNTATGAMTVTQERFQLSGVPASSLWQIPLTWTRAGAADFGNTTPTSVLTAASQVINKPAGAEWVIFNVAQSGYYRVNYDDETWSRIATALREDRESIHYLNRAQIVNDVLLFVRAGRMGFDQMFEILSFLKTETNYYVWAGCLSQLEWIRNRMAHLPVVKTEYEAFISDSMQAVIQDLGFDEIIDDSTSRILNRMMIMNYACNTMGHEACVSDSVARWQSFRANPSHLVPVNYRRYVYCSGVRNGDRADYDFLWNIYNTSENTADMVVMLRTLACTKDQDALYHYLEQTMRNDLIRIHDRTNAFAYALQGNTENLQTVLTFLYENYAEIRESYGGSARLVIAINSLSSYLTEFQDIINFQTWLYANQLNLEASEFSAGVSVISASINNLSWGNNRAVELVTSLREASSSSHILASITLLVSALVVNLFK